MHSTCSDRPWCIPEWKNRKFSPFCRCVLASKLQKSGKKRKKKTHQHKHSRFIKITPALGLEIVLKHKSKCWTAEFWTPCRCDFFQRPQNQQNLKIFMLHEVSKNKNHTQRSWSKLPWEHGITWNKRNFAPLCSHFRVGWLCECSIKIESARTWFKKQPSHQKGMNEARPTMEERRKTEIWQKV